MQTQIKLKTNLHFTRKITGFIDLKQDVKMPHLDMNKFTKDLCISTSWIKPSGNETLGNGLLGRVGTRVLDGESTGLHNWMGAGLRQLLPNNFSRQSARFPSSDSIGFLGRIGAGLLRRERARLSQLPINIKKIYIYMMCGQVW